MNESKGSWTKETLIDQLEEMQQEIESQDQRIVELDQMNIELQEQLNQKEEQNQNLLSEISKLQSELQKLSKELQIKSDKIVMLKSADLILKENEILKEKDRKREIESNRRKEELETEVKAVKDAFKESRDELEYYKDLQKKKIAEYDQKINEQDKLIDEYAEQKFKKHRSILEKKYHKKNSELSAAYTARNTALLSQLFSSILYAAIVTLLTAVKSDTFINDIKNFFMVFASIIIKYIGLTFKAGKTVAVICTRIDNPTIQNILYWLVTILIIIVLVGIPSLIIYFVSKNYITWYKEEIYDSISLLVAVITLALTIFLSDELKMLIPVNLITTNIIVHLAYSGIRAYIRGCKRNRGYY